ncbi:hypothetical protein [Amycolatopsis circi]|uniref:hypothetical protein n=1 Tax=Amycolatopsis circi TaxID=871959 RepID=UPI0013BE8CFE|nr:hypothetical protein [Amycolatopsis circi]
MPDISAEHGTAQRNAFDRDFTRILATRPDPASQNTSMGWLDASGRYTQLSPTAAADDLVTESDEYPNYHAAGNRIYFWHTTKSVSTLTSVEPDGRNSRDESALAKKFGAEGLTAQELGGPGKAKADLADSAAPVLTVHRTVNRAGTLGALVTPRPGLVLAAPEHLSDYDNSTDGGIPITGDVADQVRVDAFVTDTTLIGHADKQLYRLDVTAGTVKPTLLFENDKLEMGDATPSPDGTTLAFLGRTDTGSALYTVPITGGTPKKLASFGYQAAILDYRP